MSSAFTKQPLVATSQESWEKACAAAVAKAAESLRGLRIAEVVELDMQIEDGKVTAYRTKVKVPFKFESQTARSGQAVLPRTLGAADYPIGCAFGGVA